MFEAKSKAHTILVRFALESVGACGSDTLFRRF